MRRPAHLERPQQSVSETGQCGGEGVSGHAPPQGPCENLTCALKWLANFQMGGSNLVDTIFEGLQEQSRLKITNGVKTGDREKNSEAIIVVKRKFKESYQNAAVRKG